MFLSNVDRLNQKQSIDSEIVLICVCVVFFRRRPLLFSPKVWSTRPGDGDKVAVKNFSTLVLLPHLLNFPNDHCAVLSQVFGVPVLFSSDQTFFLYTDVKVKNGESGFDPY